MSLSTLPADASREAIGAALRRDGAVIIDRAASELQVDTLLAEMNPYIEATPPGKERFGGLSTQRTGNILARSKASHAFAMCQPVLAACEEILRPYCKEYQLHLTQIIKINPGQPQQFVHKDQWAWDSAENRMFELYKEVKDEVCAVHV
jgi:hypothetical protein